MVEQLEPPKPAAATAATPVDLSAEIARHLGRDPSDRVTCRHIDGDHYRCNWWAPADGKGYDNPHMGGLTVTTHRVRKSAFLRATRTNSGLTIREG